MVTSSNGARSCGPGWTTICVQGSSVLLFSGSTLSNKDPSALQQSLCPLVTMLFQWFICVQQGSLNSVTVHTMSNIYPSFCPVVHLCSTGIHQLRDGSYVFLWSCYAQYSSVVLFSGLCPTGVPELGNSSYSHWWSCYVQCSSILLSNGSSVSSRGPSDM